MSPLHFTPHIVSNEHNCICGGHTCTEGTASPVESEVLHILQKEHTHALSLLRSSPLLSSLFVSYASRAPTPPIHSQSSSSSSSPTPSHNDERWADLKTSFGALRADHDKLRTDYVNLTKQVEQDQKEMTELRERFADVQRQHLTAENELIGAQGEIKEMQTKYEAALLKLEQRDISQGRMTAELESAHAEIEQWKTEHTALGQCVIDQQMEILRIKQKAVSNLEEVQFELANLQNRYDTLDRSHTALLTETRRSGDVGTPIPMFTEVRAPRRLDSTSEWEWSSPIVDPPVASHNPMEPSTPKIDITIAGKEPMTPAPQQQSSTSKFPLDPKENTTRSEANPAVTAPGILFRAKSFKSKSKTAKVSVRASASGDKENQGAKEGKGVDYKVPWVLIKTDSEDAKESEKENDTTKEKK